MKKIIFVTASRADYGKLKNLIINLQKNKKYKVYVFVTGMHNLKKFGSTWMKIKLKKYDNIKNVIRFNNQSSNEPTDITFAKTIFGFTKIVKKISPDLIIVHGDRIEPLACASVGALNNFKIGHIEGGEVTGTVDEILRHSISKLSHIHFTSNLKAKKRLIQMGELASNIFVIGSPDIDIMRSKSLPTLKEVKKHYNINFNEYAIAVLHSVTTDIVNFKNYTKIFIRMLPSMNFEHYLTLLKNSNFIIGNSSSGIMEAPYFGVPTINIGNRQDKRSTLKTINNINFQQKKIIKLINYFFKNKVRHPKKYEFGNGKSFELFETILNSGKIWKVSPQKTFKDLKLNYRSK